MQILKVEQFKHLLIPLNYFGTDEFTHHFLLMHRRYMAEIMPIRGKSLSNQSFYNAYNTLIAVYLSL